MATSLLAIVLPCSIVFFYGWQASTVIASPVLQAYCQDHVGMDMTCKDIPYFCNNTYAQRVCPRTCGFCDPASSTVVPVVAPPHSITDGDCFDRIVNGLTCDELHNFCSDEYAVSLCASTCNFCTPIEQTFQYQSTVRAASTVVSVVASSTGSSIAFTFPRPQECVDDVLDHAVCNYPRICSNTYVQKVCRKSCGLCCADHLHELSCEEFQKKYNVNPCTHPLGQAACAKFCEECFRLYFSITHQ